MKNTSSQNSISDTVSIAQAHDVNERLKKQIDILNSLSEKIEKDFGEYLTDSFEPTHDSREQSDKDKEDKVILDSIQKDFDSKVADALTEYLVKN